MHLQVTIQQMYVKLIKHGHGEDYDIAHGVHHESCAQTSMIRRQCRRRHHHMISCMIVKACTTEQTYTHTWTNTIGIHVIQNKDEPSHNNCL